MPALPSEPVQVRLRRIQAALGVEADGVLGPETLTALEARLDIAPKPATWSLQCSRLTLDEIVRGETIKGRAIVVRRYQSINQLDTCHILFIDRSQNGQIDAIVAALKGRSVLTVGDFDGFARHGGMIRFVTVGNKIRLRVNLTAAQQVSLAISSKLLRPAQVLEPGQD